MPPLWPPVPLTYPSLVACPFHRPGWVYEEKYDGWRLVAYKCDDRVWLLSRRHRDHTQHFPALAAAIAALAPARLILDGEVAVFDRHLVSRCEWLRRRNPAALATPPSTWSSTCCGLAPAISGASPCIPAAPRWSTSWPAST